MLKAIPLVQILVENSSFSRIHLKDRLYKEGKKKRECELCGQTEEWKGNKIALILDHINGINNDHRESNLRIVCPNCNAALDTFAGRNTKKTKKVKELRNTCGVCGKLTSNLVVCSRSCRSSRERLNTRKVPRPSKENLEKEIWNIPTSILARQYGVSDNAISKWCKSYNISKPSRGYWNKLRKKPYGEVGYHV